MLEIITEFLIDAGYKVKINYGHIIYECDNYQDIYIFIKGVEIVIIKYKIGSVSKHTLNFEISDPQCLDKLLKTMQTFLT